MVFSFSNVVSQELPKHPLHGLISNLIGGYGQGIKAHYMPHQIQADIFNKEISPLAALASNPNFTGFNPEIQQMIAGRIGKYLNNGSSSSSGSGENVGNSSPAGYASDQDIYNRLSHGAHETFGQGKRAAVGRSRLLNLGEQFGLPQSISNKLGGTKASQEQATFDQALEEGIQRLKMKGYSDASARQLLERIPGENDQTYEKRIKPLFLRNDQENINQDSNENENEQESADVDATAKAFNASPDDVREALKLGVKTPKEFKEFLEWKNK